MITAYFTRELSLLQPAFRLWVLVISVLVLAHMSYLSTRCRNPLVRARIPNLPLSLPPRFPNWYDFRFGENYLVDVTQMWRSLHLMAFLMKTLTSKHQMESLWDVICWNRTKILRPSVMLSKSPKTSTRVSPKMRYVIDDTTRQVTEESTWTVCCRPSHGYYVPWQCWKPWPPDTPCPSVLPSHAMQCLNDVLQRVSHWSHWFASLSMCFQVWSIWGDAQWKR